MLRSEEGSRSVRNVNSSQLLKIIKELRKAWIQIVVISLRETSPGVVLEDESRPGFGKQGDCSELLFGWKESHFYGDFELSQTDGASSSLQA